MVYVGRVVIATLFMHRIELIRKIHVFRFLSQQTVITVVTAVCPYVRLLPDILGDRDFIVPEFKKYMKMMNSRGVTSVKEMGFDCFYGFTDVLADLEAAGDLTLRVNFMSQPVAADANLEYGKAMRDKFRGEFVRFSGYNQMTDGSISQLCGYLKKPYNCADTICAQDINWEKLGKEARAVDIFHHFLLPILILGSMMP